MKNPQLAASFSLAIPGLGQLYNDQILKGMGLFLSLFLSAVLMAFVIGYPLLIATWTYGVADAYRMAEIQQSAPVPTHNI